MKIFVRNLVLAACALPLWLQANLPPEITNVKASQRDGTKFVDITYDVTDADGDLLKIRIEVSDDDGKRYTVPAFSLTGDIGENVTTGTSKKIVWDAGTDWDGEYSDQMRVKVIATDGKGYPGLEFGNEVPPGGFLMGQDGNLEREGSGPSRHVCIPWSYWLSKYEITNAQFCEFLNTAFAAGFVTQSGAASAYATASMPPAYACPVDALLCTLGDDQGLRWSVSKFEAVAGRENRPACVTWYGAMAFSRFYDYDLPTEAEWEMAARGPDHDDEDEHRLYPWEDNTCSEAYACLATTFAELTDVDTYNGNQTPMGPDTVNGYGLYDMIGNAAEWTRTLASTDVEKYPLSESLKETCNSVDVSGERIVRGAGSDALYKRHAIAQDVAERTSDVVDGLEDENHLGHLFPIGFRVVRRGTNAVEDVAKVLAVKEDFQSWEVAEHCLNTENFTKNGFTLYAGWSDVSIVDNVETNGNKALQGGSSGYGYLYLPETADPIREIRLRVKNPKNVDNWLYLYSGEDTNLDRSDCERVSVTIRALSDFTRYTITPARTGKRNSLYIQNLYVDDIEIYTAP